MKIVTIFYKSIDNTEKYNAQIGNLFIHTVELKTVIRNWDTIVHRYTYVRKSHGIRFSMCLYENRAFE